MLCEKTKEGAAQTTAGNCSQEEKRNREATVRTQQRKINGSQEQNKQNWSAALTVSVSKIWFAGFEVKPM
jgi:hypothetical protein